MNQLTTGDKLADKKTFYFDVWAISVTLGTMLSATEEDICDYIEQTARLILDDAATVLQFPVLEDRWLQYFEANLRGFKHDEVTIEGTYSNEIYDRVLTPLREQLTNEFTHALKVAPYSLWSVECDGSSLYVQYLGDLRILEWEQAQQDHTEEGKTADLGAFTLPTSPAAVTLNSSVYVLSENDLRKRLYENRAFSVQHSPYENFLAESDGTKRAYVIELTTEGTYHELIVDGTVVLAANRGVLKPITLYRTDEYEFGRVVDILVNALGFKP